MKKLKKNEIIYETVQPTLDFFKHIGPTDKSVLVFHYDDDGVCSAAIIGKVIKKFSGYSPSIVAVNTNEEIGDELIKKISAYSPKHIIILDLAIVPQKVIDELIKIGKVLVIDHHTPERYVNVVYCNPRVYDPAIYLPVTYLSYQIYFSLIGLKDVVWIAAVGVLADHGIEGCEDIFDELKLEYPKLVGAAKLNYNILYGRTMLGRLAKMFDSGRDVKGVEGAELVAKILMNAKNYEEISENKSPDAKILFEWHEKVKKELSRLIKDFQKNSKRVGKKFLLYEVVSEINLKSTLASFETGLHEDRIIVVMQKSKDRFNVSMRKGKKVKTDLVEVWKKGLTRIKGGRSGGHPEAAGGTFPAEYKETFIRNLEKMA